MITGCDHIGIQVRDVERSTQFYVENLDFTRVARWTMSKPYVQKLVGYYPDVVLEIAMLTIPGTDVFLEILEYRNVDKTPVDAGAFANPGTGHFCLFCDNLDELYEKLVARGVDFVSDVQTPVSGPAEGGRIVYLRDPDGIGVELVQARTRGDGSPRETTRQ